MCIIKAHGTSAQSLGEGNVVLYATPNPISPLQLPVDDYTHCLYRAYHNRTTAWDYHCSLITLHLVLLDVLFNGLTIIGELSVYNM